MLKKLCISFIFQLLFAGSTFAGDAINRYLTEILPGSVQYSLVVVNLLTGGEITSAGKNETELLVPGSLVKLFTTGAALALDEQSGGLKLETTAHYDGKIHEGVLYGNFYLVGNGHAQLSVEDLRRIAQGLKHIGIHRISGDVVADDSFFDGRGLERTRKGGGYAPTGALGLDLHTIALTAIATEPGEPPKVVIEPPNESVRLAVEARTATTMVSTIRFVQLDDTSYRVTGNIPVTAGALKSRFMLKDPALYSAGALKTVLRQEQVRVDGGVRRGKTPANAVQLGETEGPSLASYLRDMNMNSLNVSADNILLLLGAKRYGLPGTREKGLKVLDDFLLSLDLPPAEATVVDGSGLLGGNRVTARNMARYLVAVAKKPWFNTFRESFPRAGIEGTIRNIGYRNNRFRVKTGRLENAYALAGYGIDLKGREIVFSFIVNHPASAVMSLDQIGAAVMRFIATEEN